MGVIRRLVACAMVVFLALTATLAFLDWLMALGYTPPRIVMGGALLSVAVASALVARGWVKNIF